MEKMSTKLEKRNTEYYFILEEIKVTYPLIYYLSKIRLINGGYLEDKKFPENTLSGYMSFLEKKIVNALYLAKKINASIEKSTDYLLINTHLSHRFLSEFDCLSLSIDEMSRECESQIDSHCIVFKSIVHNDEIYILIISSSMNNYDWESGYKGEDFKDELFSSINNLEEFRLKYQTT
jgi:hypothetical protein